MNKKIKIIELLKQMEIKENLPKQIKYKNKVFDLSCSDDGIYYYANENWSMMSWIDNFYQLYEYVEILEDEDEILEDEEKIDIQELEDVNLFDNGQNFNDMPIIIKSYDDNFTNINNTINKLIQAVKQLDKKIKKE